MYSSSAREANQNNTISGLFQKLRKSELQKKLKVPHQLLDNRQNNPTDAMLLAELGNEASGSNNKGKEMTGERVGQRQENPTTHIKKKMPLTQPLPSSQMPPRNAGGIPTHQERTGIDCSVAVIIG